MKNMWPASRIFFSQNQVGLSDLIFMQSSPDCSTWRPFMNMVSRVNSFRLEGFDMKTAESLVIHTYIHTASLHLGLQIIIDKDQTLREKTGC